MSIFSGTACLPYRKRVIDRNRQVLKSFDRVIRLDKVILMPAT
jgi:hypothetical protein